MEEEEVLQVQTSLDAVSRERDRLQSVVHSITEQQRDYVHETKVSRVNGGDSS